MFCRYKGWNLGHMAQDKETCQFCINNTGIQLRNFNLLSRGESHSFHRTSRKAGTRAAGWPSQQSWDEPRCWVLPAPRERWVHSSPFCPTPACSDGAGNGIPTAQVGKCRVLGCDPAQKKSQHAVHPIPAAGEFGPQWEEVASVSPPVTS